MKKMKKLWAVVFALLLALCMCACSVYPYNTLEYSDEYFKYHVLEPKKFGGYGETECYIVGLTEKGLEQTHLIVPEYYGNYRIKGIGYQGHTYLSGAGYYGNFESDNLEKLYINYNVDFWNDQRHEVYTLYETYIVFWTSGSYGHNLQRIEGCIFGYNYYLKHFYPYLNYIDEPIKIANVSYLYNYDGAENDGYYWVDSYEESVISFIPPEPQRDGYTFGGWYKESECVNEWDFLTDITGKEIVMEERKVYDTYDGIYLYAKWIKE